MTGKKNKTGLGRSLIKDRFARRDRRNADSILHVAELNDGYDWGRLNLQSVTEQSSFEEFLATAELAGTEFTAERLNISFVNPKTGTGLLSKEEYQKFEKNKEEKKDLLKIPRRPNWHGGMTAEELKNAEVEGFLEWRRSLALLQEESGIILTPYEKNLEFWRQLWRVVERSDVIVQILDARNPLFFRCEDLEKYVKEVGENKINMLLLNKADFLTEEQRKIWATYFKNVGIRVAFFSAKAALDVILEEESEEEKNNNDDLEPEDSEEEEEEEEEEEKVNSDKNSEEVEETIKEVKDLSLSDRQSSNDESNIQNNVSVEEESTDKLNNSWKLLGQEDLIELFSTFVEECKGVEDKGYVTIGMVGYPNVGKSSTINALLQDKKVSVSATPGKTKHFQTLFLRQDIVLCDCPGLVMPSLVSTKAEMVLNGILPIDQMRDHVPPTALLSSMIPRDIIEAEYGIMIPRPLEGEDPNRPPTPEELLNAFAYCRGFMTQNGQPDNPRAARYVLKDFVTGRLLYCVAPPGVPQEDFHVFKKKEKKTVQLTPQAHRAVRVVKPTTEDVDKVFFYKNSKGIHRRGVVKLGPSDIKSEEGASGSEPNSKPWKKQHKEKRNKKEKLRRIYRHLDE